MPNNKRLKAVLAENVKTLRSARRLSQPQIVAAAKHAGLDVAQTTVSRVERLVHAGDVESLEAIAKGLGIQPWQLLVPALDPAALPQLATGDSSAVAQSPKEEILLQLFRGLFSHQQLQLIQRLRALFDANEIVRRDMGVKALRGVGDQAVREAFKDVPPHTAKRVSQKRSAKPGRDLGDAMGDFLDD